MIYEILKMSDEEAKKAVERLARVASIREFGEDLTLEAKSDDKAE